MLTSNKANEVTFRPFPTFVKVLVYSRGLIATINIVQVKLVQFRNLRVASLSSRVIGG